MSRAEFKFDLRVLAGFYIIVLKKYNIQKEYSLKSTETLKKAGS